MRNDRLEPGSWPNTAVEFFFEKPPGDAPRGLTLTVAFDASKYAGDSARERALEDAAAYETIAAQLGSSEARVTVQSSMDMRKAHELDPSIFARFAGGAAAYLRDLESSVTPAPAALSMHVAMEAENTDDIFELSAALTIARTALKMSPRRAAEFARAFEAAYAGAQSFFKVLSEGPVRDKAGAWVPWTMRLRPSGAPAGAGVAFALNGPARYYAPVPLSTVPLSRSNVPIVRYDPVSGIDWDDPVPTAFEGVNLDKLAHAALAAIDRFLAAAVDDTQSEHLVKLSQIKADLAARVASTVAPIFESTDAPPGSEARKSAIKALRQQMFTKAESVYEISAISQFEATVSSRYDENPSQFVYAPRFAGRLRSKPPCTFSPASPVLAPGKAFVSATLTLAEPQAQSHLPLDLDFDVERVLYPGVRSDLWFVRPFDSETTIGAVDIPIVLRELIAPPMLQSQDAEPAERHATDLAGALKWNYIVRYDARIAAQDAIDLSVSFNNAPEPANLAAPDAIVQGAADLFDHLARIVSVLPVMLQDPARALADFVRLAEPLPQAWTAWQATPVHATQPARIDVSLREHDKDGFLVLTRTLGANTASLPEPSIQVVAGTITYTAQPGSVPGEFFYVDETGKNLTCEAGRDVAERRVVFCGLPIALFQNASSAVGITRNRGFAQPFVYSSLSRFTNTATPHLSSPERFDVSLLSSPRRQTLATHLRRLLGTFYEGTAPGTTQSLRFDAAYAGRISDEGPDALLPIFAGARMTLDNDGAIDAANELTAVLLKWFAQNHPPAGYLRFELTLFETLSERRSPLLQLTGLELQSADIVDLPSVMA